MACVGLDADSYQWLVQIVANAEGKQDLRDPPGGWLNIHHTPQLRHYWYDDAVLLGIQ